jgi:hypothetical protein
MEEAMSPQKWVYTVKQVVNVEALEGRAEWAGNFESRLPGSTLACGTDRRFVYTCPGRDTIRGTCSGGWPEGITFQADTNGGGTTDSGFSSSSGRAVSGRIDFRPDGSIVAVIEEMNRSGLSFSLNETRWNGAEFVTTGPRRMSQEQVARYRATVVLAVAAG